MVFDYHTLLKRMMTHPARRFTAKPVIAKLR